MCAYSMASSYSCCSILLFYLIRLATAVIKYVSCTLILYYSSVHVWCIMTTEGYLFLLLFHIIKALLLSILCSLH